MSTRKPISQAASESNVVHATVVFSLIAACLLLSGCGGGSSSSPSGEVSGVDAPTGNDTETTNAKQSSRKFSGALQSKIKFKDSAGETAFSIKPQNDGAKLVDGQERELGRFNLKGSKLKIKDSSDKVLGYVTASTGKYKIKSADGKTDLWELKRKPDGDWKLEDGQGQLLYRVKKRDYGLEIEDAAGMSLFKVKLKSGKTSLRDAEEQTVYSTRGEVSVAAVSCLGLTAIADLEVRAGLLTMVTIGAGQ